MHRALLVAAITGVIILSPMGAHGAEAGLRVAAAEYLPDREFPELLPYILDGYDLKHGMGPERPYAAIVPMGATARVLLRNQSPEIVEVTGVRLNGIDLTKQIVARYKETQGIRAAGYLLNDSTVTTTDTRLRLDAAGGPIWYQVRPNPIPAGGCAEAVVRLRSAPKEKTLEITLDAGLQEAARATVNPAHPPALAIASVSFNDAINRAFVYVRSRTGGDFELQGVMLDGHPVALASDGPRSSAHGFLPIELSLAPRWDYGSYHLVEVASATGDRAAVLVRARDAFFALGMWGYRNNGNSDAERARDTCAAFRDHFFNTHMGMAGNQGDYLRSPEGLKMVEGMGLHMMIRDPARQDIRNPIVYARFLMDEPDAHDWAVQDLPDTRRVGAFGQGLVERQNHWTRVDPRALTLLNVDLTYKPENWLIYGQLPDILAADPYYQMRLLDTYWKHPGWLGRNSTPYYVFAISDLARWAAEPKPLHVILNSVSFREGDRAFRYGTPEEKRIEFYYALAAGAKGISYWWFTPYGECRGCGSDEPEAKAMMAEMARLNAEARALEPLLANAHPVADSGRRTDPLASAAPRWLMTRTLSVGTRTAIILLVNRDHASDRVGTLFQPIEKATVTFHPPPWLKPSAAFRMTREGVKPVERTLENDRLVMRLDNLQLTEALVVTEDVGLLDRTKQKWTALASRLPSAGKLE